MVFQCYAWVLIDFSRFSSLVVRILISFFFDILLKFQFLTSILSNVVNGNHITFTAPLSGVRDTRHAADAIVLRITQAVLKTIVSRRSVLQTNQKLGSGSSVTNVVFLPFSDRQRALSTR